MLVQGSPMPVSASAVDVVAPIRFGADFWFALEVVGGGLTTRGGFTGRRRAFRQLQENEVGFVFVHWVRRHTLRKILRRPKLLDQQRSSLGPLSLLGVSFERPDASSLWLVITHLTVVHSRANTVLGVLFLRVLQAPLRVVATHLHLAPGLVVVVVVVAWCLCRVVEPLVWKVACRDLRQML